MKADVFIPCFIDQLKPETARNIFAVLNHLGVETNYPEQQTCCGQVAFNSGFWGEARQLGEKFIHDFPGDNKVIIPSASCAHMIRFHYNRFFHNTSVHLEYKKLQNRAIELTDFIVNIMKVESWPGKFNAKVTIHDSCSAIRDYGLNQEPRKLLGMVEGIEVLEMESSTACCGFGGSFSVKFPQLSVDMALEKLENAVATGAEYLVTTEVSCLLQLESVAQKNQIAIKIATLADILAWSLQNYSNNNFQ
ncbi:MAG: Fe-S oxidoreductase [Bacteroidetes bacterium HGW-Bacteroidetes-6]|jgi:L-lactate dehydrogenase complex protein LldE|nr:MAG: Fe-S oxidoreductase [Bacteroidetes bacterium HGW-Bacteroidetes-6]